MTMSDREEDHNRDSRRSPAGTMSDPSDVERKVVTYNRSRSDERSPSRSPSEHKSKRKYSRSRSRSASRHRKSKRSSKYHSRSRSPKRSYKRYSRSGSRSESSSPHYRRGRGGRSHSRSPMSNRRRHNGNRDNPEPNRCLGVFGLSIYTTEQQIDHIFSKYGQVKSVQVVVDAKTGHSRGFCFVYYENYEDARVAKEQCTGMEIDGRKIRVDYSITHRPHTPTPGIYMGKPTYSESRGRWRDRDYGDYYGGSGYRGGGGGGGRYRSPSPYYSSSRSRHRGYERSRSRSYSPNGGW